MGNQAIIVLVGVLLISAGVGLTLEYTGNQLAENSADSYSQTAAREIDNSAMQMALSKLADNSGWRSDLLQSDLFNGGSKVSFKDTVINGDSAVVVRSVSYYISGSESVGVTGRTIVKPVPGYIPPIVRGTMTAFGSLDDLTSDMLIDGRDFGLDGLTIKPQKGIFAVSTGQSTYVNRQSARLGGTATSGGTRIDIAPAFPHDPRVVQTNASWPNGWPGTPDAALGLPEGTLKNIARNRLVPGSQYVTRLRDIRGPIRGVTYVEIPPGSGSQWLDFTVLHGSLVTSPSGIFILHSATTDAHAEKITWCTVNRYRRSYAFDEPELASAPTFKGIIILDKAFHWHINLLGAVALLSPTTLGGDCPWNNTHWMKYSSDAIKDATKGLKILAGHQQAGGWKKRLSVVSIEQSKPESNRSKGRGNGNTGG